MVAKLSLKGEDEATESIERLDSLALSLILRCKLLGFLDHTLDLLRRQAALLVGDRNRLRFARSLVCGGNLEDTIGVNLERDLNLRHTTGSGGNTGELELAEQVVVLGQRAFTLKHLDEYSGLIIRGGGEDLRLAGGDDRVTRDELGEHTAGGLDTKCERVNIDKQDTVRETAFAREDATLNCGAVRNSLIRVDRFGGLFAAKEFLDELLDLGDTS